MIKTTVCLVPMERYQDGGGNPVCEKCPILSSHNSSCMLWDSVLVRWYPGPKCKVWGTGSKEVKDNE